MASLRGFLPVSPGFLITFLLLVASCSNDSPTPTDPGGGGGGGGGTGGSVSDSIRTVVFNALQARIEALPRVNAAADNQTLLAYIRTRPEFEASGILRGSVWARFNDGRVYVFVNNFSETDTSSLVIPPAAKITRAPAMSGPLADENLPLTGNARIMNSLGTAFDRSGADKANFTQAKTDITNWLTSAGYTNVPTTPTIDNLKGVSNDGVMYWSSHGSYGIARNNDTLYGVWTATDRGFVNNLLSTDTLYSADLNDGSLIYFSAPHDQGIIFPTTPVKYAITHRFVTKYMSFGRSSLVFVNACLSDDDDFRAAVLSKGAAQYMGWDNYANAARACRIGRFFFDRSLGANAERPVLNPPQKGYQTYDVYGFMYNVGLAETDVDRGGGNAHATLNGNPNPADVTQLRPLIYSVTASSSELRILGWFGSPALGGASVTVGGSNVAIRNWISPSTMVCAPVEDGGDVVVTVRGRRSHAAPLTKFYGTFTYSLTSRGSLRKQVSVNAEFLADVRTNRVQVDSSPSWEVPRIIHAIRTTSGNYQASGEYRDQNGNLVESWSGSGQLSLGGGGSGGSLVVAGFIDKTGFIQSQVSVGVTAPYIRNGSTATLSIEHGVGVLQTQMTDSFVIPGASYQGGSGTDRASSTFSSFTATFAPTANTPR